MTRIAGSPPTRSSPHSSLQPSRAGPPATAEAIGPGREPQRSPQLPVLQWNKREIENYLCFPRVLEEYAARLAAERPYGPLFESVEATRFREVMRRCVEERVPPVALRNPEDRWWQTVKASDDFLDPVFESFFAALELPNLMRKSDYHRLADLVPEELIDPEVSLVLDQVVAVASSARPAGGAPTG